MVRCILTWKAGWHQKNNCVRISAAIIALAIATTVPQTAVSLSPVEVNRKAKEIAVRIQGSDRGSGAIISRQGNTYMVLTNWHVVEKSGSYSGVQIK